MRQFPLAWIMLSLVADERLAKAPPMSSPPSRRVPKLLLTVPLALTLAACNGGPGETDTSETDTMGEAEWEESLRLDTEAGSLLSAWGYPTGVVFAVGGNPDSGKIYRYSGDSWIEEVTGAPVPLLNWVDGSGVDVWVVGNEGVTLRRVQDGWTDIESPTEEPLWGVWGASSGEVWAVGGDPLTENPAVMLRFDGVAWEDVPLPTVDRPFGALFKVWGTSPDNVYAVGESGVVLHYDGASWAQEASGTTKDLISLWGAGPDEILAVGGRGIATLLRYDGASWTETLVGTEPGLNGVWMDSDGYAYVCGQGGKVGVIEPGGDSYTGERVSDLVLHGSFGFDGGRYFAVGGSLDRNAPWEGVAMVRAN